MHISVSSTTEIDTANESGATVCTSVLLRNVPENADEDYIELFLENKRNFSDVKVSKVTINRNDSTAVVDLEDTEGKTPVNYCKCTIFQ